MTVSGTVVRWNRHLAGATTARAAARSVSRPSSSPISRRPRRCGGGSRPIPPASPRPTSASTGFGAYRRRRPVAPDALRIVVLRDADGRPRILLPLVVAAHARRRDRPDAWATTTPTTTCRSSPPATRPRCRPRTSLAALGQVGRAGRHRRLRARPPAPHVGGRGQPAGGPRRGRAERRLRADARARSGIDPAAGLQRRRAQEAALEGEAPRRGEGRRRAIAGRGRPRRPSGFLAAFYAQKAARFAAMGIADPYADPAIRAFLAVGRLGREPGGRDPCPLPRRRAAGCSRPSAGP